MTNQAQIDTTAAEVIDTPLDITEDQPSDFEGEARKHGWRPREEFKGDPGKWTDAETFVKRADEVMPFLEKQNKALKREIDDLKRTMKQASDHFSKTEQRAYERALVELQAQHDNAVEMGDKDAANKVIRDMRKLEAERAPVEEAPVFDEATAKRGLAEWVDENDWYVLDDKKRTYADMQADLMGPAGQWEGGQKAWLAELSRRVERKFTDPKPSAANPGGSRAAPRGGGKTYNDLPADAKRACDKWVKAGIIKSREDYVKSYDFS